jgi:hypothetical protein
MVETTYTLALLIGGTALAFQFVLMLFGFGGDDDLPGLDSPDALADADLGGGDGHWFYEVLSLRTFSAALTFFGLAGKTLAAYGVAELPTFVLSTLVGLAAMYAVYWLFKQVFKLQHSGTENVRNAIGQPATVYVPIPASRGGMGKVTFQMQNRLVEYQAVTEEGRRLATGEKVIVVAVEKADLVCVALEHAPAASGVQEPKPASQTPATA